VLSSQGIGRKFFEGEEGGKRNTKTEREIAPISLPPFYKWWAREHTGHAPRAHLKETLHQELHVKSEDLFMEKGPFPEKYLSF